VLMNTLSVREPRHRLTRQPIGLLKSLLNLQALSNPVAARVPQTPRRWNKYCLVSLIAKHPHVRNHCSS